MKFNDDIKDPEFASRCHYARKTVAGLTQQQISKRLGLSQSMYSRYEKGRLGRGGRNGEIVDQIAEICGVNAAWLEHGPNHGLQNFAPIGYENDLGAAA